MYKCTTSLSIRGPNCQWYAGSAAWHKDPARARASKGPRLILTSTATGSATVRLYRSCYYRSPKTLRKPEPDEATLALAAMQPEYRAVTRATDSTRGASWHAALDAQRRNQRLLALARERRSV